MCFVISVQRKTYWINGIWQICLANIILQILYPCASSISWCLSVLHCKELAGQASGVKNSFKSSLQSLVPDLPPGQAALQQHPGVASPLALLRFAAYACISRPAGRRLLSSPQDCHPETLRVWLTASLARRSSHSQKWGICTDTALLQHERAKMQDVFISVSSL